MRLKQPNFIGHVVERAERSSEVGTQEERSKQETPCRAREKEHACEQKQERETQSLPFWSPNPPEVSYTSNP